MNLILIDFFDFVNFQIQQEANARDARTLTHFIDGGLRTKSP